MATTSGLGHVRPVLPIARALRDAGHSVDWAAHESVAASIAPEGFGFHPLGMAPGERVRRRAELIPRVFDLPVAQRRPLLFATNFARLEAPAKLDALGALVDRRRFDLVLFEPADLAAAPVAAAHGLPYAAVAFGGRLPDAVLEGSAEWIAELWARVGLEAPVDAGLYDHCYFHPFPPSFGARPTATTVRPMRPTGSVAAAGDAPEWCAALGRERPLVYVTFGTEFGSAAPWRALIDGLGSLDVDAVCTVSAAVDPQGLGSVPAHVHVAQFVPQEHLLGRAAVVVSHGGSGSVLGAAAAGVPQVVVPFAADQFDNAAAVCASGAGVRLDLAPPSGAPGRSGVPGLSAVTAESVASLVQAVLDDTARIDAARAVAGEIAAMPEPAVRVPDVELLVRPS